MTRDHEEEYKTAKAYMTDAELFESRNQPLRVLICGGRDFNDWHMFREKMHAIAAKHFPKTPPDHLGNFLWHVQIIAGGARGADCFAAQWASVENCSYREFPADWQAHGRQAGPLRNARMLAEGKPQLVIAFPGGRGTADMCSKALAAGVKVIHAERFGHRSSRRKAKS